MKEIHINMCEHRKLMSEMCQFTGKRKMSESDGKSSDKAKRPAPERHGKRIFTLQNA